MLYKVCSSKRFNDNQIHEIVNGMKLCLPNDQIKIYANPRFSSSEMQLLLELISNTRLDNRQTSLCLNKGLNRHQLVEMIKGFRRN